MCLGLVEPVEFGNDINQKLLPEKYDVVARMVQGFNGGCEGAEMTWGETIS